MLNTNRRLANNAATGAAFFWYRLLVKSRHARAYYHQLNIAIAAIKLAWRLAVTSSIPSLGWLSHVIALIVTDWPASVTGLSRGAVVRPRWLSLSVITPLVTGPSGWPLLPLMGINTGRHRHHQSMGFHVIECHTIINITPISSLLPYPSLHRFHTIPIIIILVTPSIPYSPE